MRNPAIGRPHAAQIAGIKNRLYHLEHGLRGSQLVARLEDAQDQLINLTLATGELKLQSDLMVNQHDLDKFLSDIREQIEESTRQIAQYNLATPHPSIRVAAAAGS